MVEREYVAAARPSDGACNLWREASVSLHDIVVIRKGWNMSRNGMCVVLAVVAMGGVSAGTVQAQWQATDVGWCEEERGGRGQDRFCLAFEAEFDDPRAVSIDGGMNGGVTVEGWARDVVEVRAKVWANARSERRAEEIARAVEVHMDRGRLSADGPDTGRRESWGVSWEVMVPHATDLDIETFNGGIGVTGVSGRIRFEALNGGVHLSEVGGDVRGKTTNGGLSIELGGSTWQGEGLDVQTTNGGVTIRVPENYSARLETGTVNGGIHIDFPVMVRGRIGRRLTTTLGEGGATVRAMTTNGGVRIVRGTGSIR